MIQDFISSSGADRLVQTVESFLNDSGSWLPATLGISSAFQMTLALIAVSIAIGIAFRVLFGKRCSANQAVAASAGIVFLYVSTVFIYVLNPWGFARYLSPLPFALFRRDILIILPFEGVEYSVISQHVLSLIILCFLVHFLDSIFPTGRSFFVWFLLRCALLCCTVFGSLTVNWIITSVLPTGIMVYAPIILLVLLGAAIVIGLFNPLLCIIFTVVNPIVGLLYTFFFSNLIGKQLTKSVLSAGVLCGIFYTLERMGFTVIEISTSAILPFLPFGLLLLAIWYIFDAKL